MTTADFALGIAAALAGAFVLWMDRKRRDQQ